MENKDCIIEINSECCVCLDLLNADFNKLDCCGNIIHTKCIYDMFVHKQENENKEVVFTCPLCRKYTNFKNVISFKDIKKYTNDKNIINKYKLRKVYIDIELCKLVLTKLLIIIVILILIYIFYRVLL